MIRLISLTYAFGRGDSLSGIAFRFFGAKGAYLKILKPSRDQLTTLRKCTQASPCAYRT